MRFVALAVAALVCLSAGIAQKPEYDFYPEYRNTFVPNLRAENPSITNPEILESYAAKLERDGIAADEILRRLKVLRAGRGPLEADYWNRFFTSDDSNFNKAPNGFLVEVAEGLDPGTALDYGMGEGRNALYLAKLGWDVSGFDPADAAVALAQERARELGLTLHTAAVRDSDFEFGHEQFDLILFSWTMPLVPVERVVAALKPGGIVVMECAAGFVGRNGMLKMFDDLRIERYEIVRATADFYDRKEEDVLRMVARKPQT